MPTYEYKVKEGHEGCDYCKDGFEITQKISDDPLEKCPKCESPLERLVSGGTGFLLKGGGWGKDGYSSPTEKK